ncbi:hypothetical protein HAX54_034950, partial [Datura stramonium]|nr:hypothetical protein [Datura stramonium]
GGPREYETDRARGKVQGASRRTPHLDVGSDASRLSPGAMGDALWTPTSPPYIYVKCEMFSLKYFPI